VSTLLVTCNKLTIFNIYPFIILSLLWLIDGKWQAQPHQDRMLFS
jgi:hypothetical protein